MKPSKIPKLLHVVLSMNVGGAEKLVYDMVRHETFAEQKPVICCLDELGELGDKLRKEGFKVYVKERNSGLDWRVIAWLRAVMRAENIQVVHAHQYTPLFYTVPSALLAGRLKVVYTEHGRFYPDRKSWKRTLVNPILAKGVDHLVSISAATADAMARYDYFTREKIQVIHNGVDLSRLNPPMDMAAKRRELGLSDTCKIIGTAARLNEIKNIPMMLRVYKKVLEQVDDVCLVIAGDGPEEQNLKKMAANLRIADQVKFIGLRHDMSKIYPLFDVFLSTSFTEGISITLLEAMGSRVPAIVTDVGGNKEIISSDEMGRLFPLSSDLNATNYILELLHDFTLRKEISYYAQCRVNVSFSFLGMLKKYTDLYIC